MNFDEFYKNRIRDSKELQKIAEDKDAKFLFDVANLITEARLYAGLTQAELAKKMKTNQPSIARIERGSNLPSLSFLLKIAKALDTYLVPPAFGFMVEKRSENVTIHVSPYTVANSHNVTYYLQSKN